MDIDVSAMKGIEHGRQIRKICIFIHSAFIYCLYALCNLYAYLQGIKDGIKNET